MGSRALAIAVLVSSFLLCARAWASEPPGQAVGFYSHGHLVDASELPMEGPAFSHLFRARQRNYGTQGLVDLFESVANRIAAEFPGGERLQVGDISAQHGGPISGHASHQIGLDMDVVYLRVNHREQDPGYLKSFDELFVAHGKVTANFDLARNWELVRLWAASGRLDRIFVDPAIKAALCVEARKLGDYSRDAEALRRLRPLGGHADHMHVRLTCPKESPKCIPQADVPPGTGCPAAREL